MKSKVMKIEVTKKEFLKALSVGGSLAGTKKLLPILDCVKIKVTEGKLTFVSSDIENAISKSLTDGVTTDGEGAFCVMMKELMSYVKLVKSELMQLIVEDNMLTIKHENGKMELPAMDAADFPTIKPDENSIEFEMDAAILYDWIAYGFKFSATDELRSVMNGLYVYKEGKEIGCCATDGHLLYSDSYEVGEEKAAEVSDFSFILNRSAFKSISDAIATEENVSVRIGERNVMFRVDGCSIIARLIEGRYPNFKNVIPRTSRFDVVIGKGDLLDSLSRCMVAANKSTMLTKLSFEGFMLKVSCEDIDFSKKNEEEVTIEGNAYVTVGMNAASLSSAVNAIQTKKLEMKIIDKTRAVVLKEVEGNDRKILLSMPMMIDD